MYEYIAMTIKMKLQKVRYFSLVVLIINKYSKCIDNIIVVKVIANNYSELLK